MEIVGNAQSNVILGGKGDDTFIYAPDDSNDTIFDYQSGDLLQITDGTFTSSKYSKGTLTLTVGNGSVIFKNVTTSTNFNINGDAYHISGKKLIK